MYWCTGSIYSSNTTFTPLTGLKSSILGRFTGAVVNESTGLPLGPFFIDVFGSYNATSSTAFVASFYSQFGGGNYTLYTDVPGRVIRTNATVTNNQNLTSLTNTALSMGRKLAQVFYQRYTAIASITGFVYRNL